jgi:NADPH:quinone reductase-like Zn-dependent oxidoreductase
VLVKVSAASVHADVWHVVCGHPRVIRLTGAGFRRPKNPIPGTDMSGVVEAVGRNVSMYKPGDEVFGETIAGYQWVNGGAFAEYVAVPESNLARKPGNLSHPEAASVPTSGYIAYLNLIFFVGVTPGQRVLVNGAAGNVGAIALQLARSLGAGVTAVDHSKKLEILKKLGANQVIDYTTQDYTRMGEKYDLIFDVPGNFSLRQNRKALLPKGKYVAIGHEAYGKNGKRNLGLIPQFMAMMVRGLIDKQLPTPTFAVPPKQKVMSYLAAELEKGTLTPVIEQVFPLKETARALHCLTSTNPNGRILVAPEH